LKILNNVSYDGEKYSGFQIQKNDSTIQAELEKSLSQLYNRDISVIGASRTDSGVHALGQKFTFNVISSSIAIDKLPTAINARLPDDIVVTNSIIVDEYFHPRFDAKEKIYLYKILNTQYQNPILKNYVCHFKNKIDVKLMQKGAKYFIGTHDFLAFCSAGSSVKSTVRTIFDISIKEENGLIELEFRGDGFLYNMIRIIVGTLLDCGTNKILPQYIEEIIFSKDRHLAGKTAPAHALTLMDILY
jgi:tRNA pseudouridine38-40 synthase